MIGRLLTHGAVRKALDLTLAAAAIVLFLLNLRRAGERAGRAAERLDAGARTDAICRRMLDAAALLIAMLCLTGCGMVGSETRAPCPPVVDYPPPIRREQPTRCRRWRKAPSSCGY